MTGELKACDSCLERRAREAQRRKSISEADVRLGVVGVHDGRVLEGCEEDIPNDGDGDFRHAFGVGVAGGEFGDVAVHAGLGVGYDPVGLASAGVVGGGHGWPPWRSVLVVLVRLDRTLLPVDVLVEDVGEVYRRGLLFQDVLAGED